MQEKTVLITGIGLVSSLGEGVEVHWEALQKGQKPHLNTQSFAPYSVHALGEVDWSLQIPKRSDKRQMDTWQRLGTYAAGLALDDAGLKEDSDLLSSIDMIVAAGGGERDAAVDSQILAHARETNNRETMLNKMLSTELRPTLFLAQLSNLLAGNISIVHKVTGSSRSFMGEEGAGLSAVEVATSRIRNGQSTHALVGGSYNCEHFDMLLGHELDGLLHAQQWGPLWDRKTAKGGGLVTGSGGVFLILEEAEHARARGAKAYAAINAFETGQANRQTTDLTNTFHDMCQRCHVAQGDFVVSAASGVDGVTQHEEETLKKLKTHYRGVSNLFGHLREAQFPFSLALAAIAIHNKKSFAPLSPRESEHDGTLTSGIVTCLGIKRAEGVARLVSV